MVLATLACALCLPVVLLGQTLVLRGRITGSDSVALSGASISATNSVGHLVATRSQQNGDYRIALDGRDTIYVLTVTALGYAPGKRVLRISAPRPDQVIADFTLTSALATLEPVITVATRPRPPRDEDGLFRTPGQTRYEVDVSSGVAGSLTGDLFAALGMVPGLVRTPSGSGAIALSAFGLSAEQNGLTLNGTAFPGFSLPRDGLFHQVRLSTYDPKYGRYAGIQVASSLPCGCLDPTRRVRVSADGVRWHQPGDQGFGSRVLSGVVSGEIRAERSFYSVAYQVTDHRAVTPTAFSLDARSLGALGISSDSIARARSLAALLGLPAGSARPVDAGTTTGSLLVRVDLTPGPVPAVNAMQPTAYVLAAAALSRSARPGASLPSSSLQSGEYSRRDAQLLLVFAPYLLDALNETKASLSISRTDGRPNSPLPRIEVQIPSGLGASVAAPVTIVQLAGGGQARTSEESSALQVTNETSWMTRDGGHKFQIFGDVVATSFSSRTTASSAGRYLFTSLADLESGRPSLFSRTMGEASVRGSLIQGVVAISDIVKTNNTAKAQEGARGEDFTLQFGARIEAERFGDTARLSPAIQSAFGVGDGSLPLSISISPMLGFTWTKGYYQEDVPGGGWFTANRHYVTGGIRAYRGAVSVQTYSHARQQTGEAASPSTLQCIGVSAPVPDWSSIVDPRVPAPSDCVQEVGGTFPRALSSVTLFARDFNPQRSWRSELNWRYRASGRVYLTAAGSYALSLGGIQSYDLNFDGTPKAHLGWEKDRELYVYPESIDPQSGMLSYGGSRALNGFGAVSELRSDLRSEQYQTTIGVEYQIGRSVGTNAESPDRNRFTGTFRGNYTLAGGRAQSTGFSASTAGNPRQMEWSRSSQPRHTLQAVLTGQLDGWFALGASARWASGMRYTPIVSTDVNGDGFANDRAFVADPAADLDTTLAGGMRALLARAPASARECLSRQVGKISGDNSCVGPGSVTLGTISVELDSYRIGLGNRGSLTLYLENLPSAVDQILHGARELRGWGQGAYPDPALLHVRGFSPSEMRFRYLVNPSFGSTTAERFLYRAPARLTVDVRFDIGQDAETRGIEESVRLAKQADFNADSVQLGKFLMRLAQPRLSSDMWAILRVKDSIALTADQADRIESVQQWYKQTSDSVYRSLGNFLFSRQGRYGGEGVRARWHEAISVSVRAGVAASESAREILTAEQLSWLRSRKIARGLFFSREWLERTLRGPLTLPR